MMDAIRQASLSEVMLLFVLVFVLPGMTYLLMRLRRYEMLYGLLPDKKKKKRKKEPDPDASPAEEAVKSVEPSLERKYPYKARLFLSPPERACLAAMREALGGEVDVYPKAALWETVESEESEPFFRDRLRGLDYDFLVCDKATGRLLTAVMFNPGRGRPAGPGDTIKKVCQAAGVNVVFIDLVEEYDVDKMKRALGIPELDL